MPPTSNSEPKSLTRSVAALLPIHHLFLPICQISLSHRTIHSPVRMQPELTKIHPAVPFGAMHLLQLRPRKKHLPPASTPPRMPQLPNAMKEHNPENPILHESINGPPISTPPQPKSNKKRDHETMIHGFQGEASASRSFPIPKPVLERDFQMSVQLNPKIGVGPGIWGQRNWISYISGHWNGRWGKGTVVVSYVSSTKSMFPTDHLIRLRICFTYLFYSFFAQ